MTTRKLNTLELKVHQAAISNPDKTLTQKELVALAPDAATRTDAINFLLATGMLKALTRPNGTVSAYRAVMKRELDVKKDMSGEEAMVFGHIQAAGNKGIWTKHLKAKTELHQTVIDRCLKSLLQKQLVKVVKSVEHRTRKMYMLSHLEPAVELTGGPWYTDNELDTEFIKNLSAAILHYIKDRSFPKQKRTNDQPTHSTPLYPISAAPSYPTAQQIQTFLTKSKITETRLSIEHVEMLLNVLILDGEIEKVPAFGAAFWESTVNEDEEDEEESDDHRANKKRKRRSDREKDKRKHKRRKQAPETDTEDPSEDKTQKKLKKRRREDLTDTDDHQRKMHKKRTKPDNGEERPNGKKGNRKSKRVSPDSSSSSSSASSASSSESDSESDEDERSRRSKKSHRKRSSSSMVELKNAPTHDDAFGSGGGAHIYRAIRQERVALGWSQAPCGRCPVFDFCKEKGPVNPTECVYYEAWLESSVVATS